MADMIDRCPAACYCAFPDCDCVDNSLPAGTKIERAAEPPYLSDELVEQIAVLHNGGKWPDDYKESHRQHWRGQAVKIIELVKQYLDNPMYVVTVGGRASDEELVREMFSAPGHIEVHTRLDGKTKPPEGV